MEARRITREMEDIRSKATYDAYADLLMNERQVIIIQSSSLVCCLSSWPLMVSGQNIHRTIVDRDTVIILHEEGATKEGEGIVTNLQST